MLGGSLLAYGIALILVSIALAFSISVKIFHDSIWFKWNIVFLSCLLGTMFLGFSGFICTLFLPEMGALVFDYIFTIIINTVMSFVLVLLPYFLKWIIRINWGSRHRIIFYSLSVIYFVSGLTGVIIGDEFIISYIKSIIFISVLIYCITVLWTHLSLIEDVKTQSVCKAINIVSIVLIPTVLLVRIFPLFENLAYPVYVIAVSIIMIVYYSLRLGVDKQNIRIDKEKEKSFSSEILNQYKITERENEIIELIYSGLTNKEIAYILSISVNTVNNHVSNIFGKMNVGSRVELIRILTSDPWD